MSLKVSRDIRDEVTTPILIAGWPGMGSVGVGAVNYLRRSLEADACAEIDLRSFFTPDMVIVEEGLAVETNMVRFDIRSLKRTSLEFVDALIERHGVRVSAPGPTYIRAIPHLGIAESDIDEAAAAIRSLATNLSEAA